MITQFVSLLNHSTIGAFLHWGKLTFILPAWSHNFVILQARQILTSVLKTEILKKWLRISYNVWSQLVSDLSNVTMLPSDDSFIFENRLPLMYIVHSTIRWNDFGILTMLKSRWVIYDPPQANQVHQERNGPLVCPTVVIPCSPSQLQSSEKVVILCSPSQLQSSEKSNFP